MDTVGCKFSGGVRQRRLVPRRADTPDRAPTELTATAARKARCAEARCAEDGQASCPTAPLCQDGARAAGHRLSAALGFAPARKCVRPPMTPGATAADVHHCEVTSSTPNRRLAEPDGPKS